MNLYCEFSVYDFISLIERSILTAEGWLRCWLSNWQPFLMATKVKYWLRMHMKNPPCKRVWGCRADWIRTSDPYVPNVVRYRAALLPVSSAEPWRKRIKQSSPSLKLRWTLSGGLDSNQRPLAPHANALPGCATTRRSANLHEIDLKNLIYRRTA